MSQSPSQESVNLENNLLLNLGFTNQTPIQQQGMQVLATGHSLLGLAPTGSGKTLAFLVPLMQKIQPSTSAIQLLILVPTRELGAQIALVANKVAKQLYVDHNISLLVRTAFGGQKSSGQKTELLKNPHVVIATPGRCIEFIENRVISLRNLVAVVLDEADLMLGMGFESQVNAICNNFPKQTQIAMFSATHPNFKSALLDNLLKGAIKIDVREEDSPAILGAIASDDLAPNLEALENSVVDIPASHEYLHQYLTVPTQAEKNQRLIKVLQKNSDIVSSGIIFCQTREGAHLLCLLLQENGFSAAELSGELGQVQRSTVLRRFKAGGVQYLVATNIASRGIDVKDLSIVINYDLPSTPEEYVHRVGRTGRAGKAGWALSLCTENTEGFFAELMAKLNITVEKYKYVWTETEGKSLSDKEGQVPPAGNFIRLHLNRGKSDKMRPGDILGAFSKDMGIAPTDIGSIFIFDHFTHVEVNKLCVKKIICGLEQTKIKNLRVKAIEAVGLAPMR